MFKVLASVSGPGLLSAVEVSYRYVTIIKLNNLDNDDRKIILMINRQ